jgi:hypothetical protein
MVLLCPNDARRQQRANAMPLRHRETHPRLSLAAGDTSDNVRSVEGDDSRDPVIAQPIISPSAPALI